MKRVIFYVRNELKKSINLSKIGLVIRKLNDEEYNDLFDGFKKIILDYKELQLAKAYYDFKNKKRNLPI